jgi:hypothetical protein
MPQSRNRPGHVYQKPADIPARQRVKGRVIWAVLFAVFGTIIAYFAAGKNYAVLAGAALMSGAIGYIAGKNMEQAASK